MHKTGFCERCAAGASFIPSLRTDNPQFFQMGMAATISKTLITGIWIIEEDSEWNVLHLKLQCLSLGCSLLSIFTEIRLLLFLSACLCHHSNSRSRQDSCQQLKPRKHSHRAAEGLQHLRQPRRLITSFHVIFPEPERLHRSTIVSRALPLSRIAWSYTQFDFRKQKIEILTCYDSDI